MSGFLESCRKNSSRHKLFRKLKKSKLTVDEVLYKEARNTVQTLIKDKKKLDKKAI